MPVLPEDIEPSARVLRISREISQMMQEAVQASGTTTPMLDFVMVAGTVHAYILGFAIANGSDKAETLAAADKLVRKMTDVFTDKRRPH